jgi:predicted transcriptional regulator
MATSSTTSLKLDQKLKQRVQRLAAARRRSAHWIMHEAVEQYVGREEKREKLRLDALAAWNQYQTTGLHATAGEADAWLAKLEAGEDAEAPTAVHQSPSAETTNAKWPLPQEEATSRRVKNGK